MNIPFTILGMKQRLNQSQASSLPPKNSPIVMEIQLWRSKMLLQFGVQYYGATCYFGVFEDNVLPPFNVTQGCMFPKGCKNRCDLVQELPKVPQQTDHPPDSYYPPDSYSEVQMILPHSYCRRWAYYWNRSPDVSTVNVKNGQINNFGVTPATPMISWSVTSSTVIEYVPSGKPT